MIASTDNILQFWFGEATNSWEINNEKRSLWWAKNEAVDQEINKCFETVLNGVANGELRIWQDSPKGLLASIICTDQFPRNMYRATSKSFAFDDIALELAMKMVDRGWDKDLLTIYRMFCYLPFEHSEELPDQEKAVNLIGSLRYEATLDDKELFENCYQFARRHYQVIEQYGRFPHRNEILGRVSTEQELLFLKQPGSSF